ncbi:hypothetical protein BASA81_008737 [Batrachochytrium salamandrivorans]|nr:hypothetical protein BASA81_008737 [Batrachochytrium salamandrivorans]
MANSSSSSWWKPAAAATAPSKPAPSSATTAAPTIAAWGSQLFGTNSSKANGRVPLPQAAPVAVQSVSYHPPPAPAPATTGEEQADDSINSSTLSTTTPSPLVMEMIKSIYLESGDSNGYCYQTSIVHLRMKSGTAFDPQLVGLKWFRAEEGGTFDSLNCSEQSFQPSVDDVDKRLCVQCYDLLDETSASFVEYGPVIMDPKVLDASQHPNLTFCLTEVGTSTLVQFEYLADQHVLVRNGETLEVKELWQVVSNMPTQVVVDGMRAFDFESAFDRDVATLTLRKHFPPVSEAKLLRERIRELDTQLQIATKKSSMAETGKALAEIQSLKREVDKFKLQNQKLQQELDTALTGNKKLQETVRNHEHELAKGSGQAATHNQVQAHVARLEELCNAREGEITQLKTELVQRAQQAADFPAMQIKVGTAAKRVQELEQRLNASQEETQRLAGRRNASAQKADSLAKDMARLLRLCPGGVEEVDAVQRENAKLKQMLTELRTETKQLRQQTNLHAANSSNSGGGGSNSTSFSARPPLFGINLLPGKSTLSGGGALGKDPNQLGALANSLVLEVRAKDEQLELLQSTIDMLNIRNTELGRRLRDRGGEMTE